MLTGEEVRSSPCEQFRGTCEVMTSRQEGLPLGVSTFPGELNTDIGLFS